MSAEIVNIMMTLRDQVKIYHWQTMSYPRHIATNDLLPKLDTNIVTVLLKNINKRNMEGALQNIKSIEQIVSANSALLTSK